MKKAFQRTELTTANRQVCARLYNERRNPEHLQANLTAVTDRAMELMTRQGIGTTRDSIVITLGYLGRGDATRSELCLAVLDAVNGR